MSESTSEEDQDKKVVKRAAKTAGLLLTGAAVGAAGGVAANQAAQPTQYVAWEQANFTESGVSSPTEAAARSIGNEVSLDHFVNVAFGQKAVVTFGDGSHIEITNPIVTAVVDKDDAGEPNADLQTMDYRIAVAGRTEGSDWGEGSLVTAYLPGEDDVTQVKMEGEPAEFGDPNLYGSEPAPVDRPQGVADDNTGLVVGDVPGSHQGDRVGQPVAKVDWFDVNGNPLAG